MMSMYLSDTELAKAGQDLTSWVLQDDSFDQYFCYAAKETQASPAGDVCEDPFMILPDDFLKSSEDDLFSCDIFMPSETKSDVPYVEEFPPLRDTFIDEEMDMHEQLKQEIRDQQEHDQLQFSREQEQIEFKMEQEQIEPQKEQHEEQIFSIPEYHISYCIDEEPMKVDSQEEHFLASPQEVTESTPYIISVPVSEALKAQKEEETYSIVSEVNSSKPFVINLKTVTIPKKQSTQPKIVTQPTLKDIFESGDFADEHITDFMSSPSSSSFMPSPSSSVMLSPPSSCSSSPLYSEVSGYESTNEEKKSKPYSLIEKKLRKKEQNKRAALRYRQKKKQEEGSVQSLLDCEMEKQKKLIEEYEGLQVEVKFMQKLARDMLSARKRNSSP